MSNINVKIGDLFASEAQTLVNTVNCVGVMGKGIALQFKKHFPDMYDDYLRRCEQGGVQLGKPYLYQSLVAPQVVNFPTKGHWRAVSKLSDIVKGLCYLEAHYKEWGITSLAVPPLGCGNGQLDWQVVGPTLYRHLSRLDIPVELYAPPGTPKEELSEKFLAGSDERSQNDFSPTNAISAAAVALVGVVSRINRERYHWPIGRTSFQKIAYFLGVEGVPTGVTHKRGSYGPYAAELKSLVAKLENNGVLTEERQGRAFVVKPGPTYPDARERYRDDLRQWVPAVEKVADLFVRLPGTKDAEIAASVHFVATEYQNAGKRVSEKEVFDEVLRWKARRRPPLREEEVASMVRHLNMMGWVKLAPSKDLPLDESSYGAVA